MNLINAKLLKRETISVQVADEEWLDNEANTVDEQCILDELEEASDYEQGVEWLSKEGNCDKAEGVGM